MPHLERFKLAQAERHSGFETALSELHAGRKTGHWIWYVFPQLAGLGMSEMSRVYGIAGVAEATDYLRHPVLRGRLLSAASAVLEATERGVPLSRLMGSSIDVVKLVSSMTLFGAIAGRMKESEPGDDYRALADVAAAILKVAEADGYPPCEFTITFLERQT